jgi:hypothetical protein
MDLAAYWPAHSIPSDDSPRLRGFGRPLQRGVRPLRGEASSSAEVEGAAAAVVIVISSDDED